MEPVVQVMLWSMLAFEAKHFICDFVIQTEYQVRTKGIYGHPGGFLHSGAHAVASIPAILVWGPSLQMLGAIMLAEFLIHYHMDWTKERITRRKGLTVEQGAYWTMLGFDQFVHQLTYVAIIAVLAGAFGPLL
jgi:hypothetical protein